MAPELEELEELEVDAPESAVEPLELLEDPGEPELDPPELDPPELAALPSEAVLPCAAASLLGGGIEASPEGA